MMNLPRLLLSLRGGRPLALAWDESQHPRDPAGTTTGGRFTSDELEGEDDIYDESDFQEELRHWEKSLSIEEIDAIERWTKTDWTTIREYEKDGVDDALVRAFNGALDKAPKYDGVVFRGLHIVSKDLKDKLFTVGAEVGFRASSSASRDSDVARSFAVGSRVILQIRCKTGVSIENLSNTDEPEQEVVLRRNTRYRVVRVVKARHTIVNLEEIAT